MSRLALVCTFFLLYAANLSAQQPADAPRTVQVFCLAYSTGSDGKGYGTCSPLDITVGGPTDGKPRIGFFESEVGGSGPQWRAAGWTAAVTAAQITDFSPSATKVSFSVEGRIDGPSAGALMTIGVLAGVLGDTVRSDAAMTGTINPDGTIGPVGGIVRKIEGAAGQGKKLVLIPAGMRVERDSNIDEDVDLVEHGRNHGVDVRQVIDIYSAYKLMTGKELGRPPDADRPLSNPLVEAMVKNKLTLWQRRYATALARYKDLPQQDYLVQELIDSWKSSVSVLGRSESLFKEGEFAAAYWDRIMANMHAYMTMEWARCRSSYRTHGLDGAVKRVRDNSWLQSLVDETALRLQAKTPKTFDQLTMYVCSCDALLQALAYQKLAQQTLDNLPDEEEKAAEQALRAAGYQIVAWLDLQLVDDYLDFGDVFQGEAIPADAPVYAIADFYRRSAEANQSVFESLVIEPNARAAGISAQQVRQALSVKDEAYGVFRISLDDVQPQLSKYFGKGPALGYAYLATSLYLHRNAAGMVAKYYSLSAKLEDFKIVGVRSEGTLNDWLRFTEDQSRRNIAALKARGIDPTSCAQIYDIAHVMRARELDEKLSSLDLFWRANLNAVVLRRLSRAGAKPSP